MKLSRFNLGLLILAAVILGAIFSSKYNVPSALIDNDLLAFDHQTNLSFLLPTVDINTHSPTKMIVISTRPPSTLSPTVAEEPQPSDSSTFIYSKEQNIIIYKPQSNTIRWLDHEKDIISIVEEESNDEDNSETIDGIIEVNKQQQKQKEEEEGDDDINIADDIMKQKDILENEKINYHKLRSFPYSVHERDREYIDNLLFSDSHDHPDHNDDPIKKKNQRISDDDYFALFSSANRGSGYDPYEKFNETINHWKKPWRVVLWESFGRSTQTLHLSGCPGRRRFGECPFHPHCMIYPSDNFTKTLQEADVIVISANGHVSQRVFSEFESIKRPDQIMVLYQREPSYLTPLPLQKRFDLQMGVRISMGILNPVFFHEPAYLHSVALKYHKEFEERRFFAFSLISHCGAKSKRDEYINRLVNSLGKRRIHQYGACGDGHKLSRNPVRVLEKSSYYKFYFAFENTIEPGYVTEKLGNSLVFGPIPIYYGAPNPPRITKTPSYIDASDFKSPEHLAKYLLYLSDNKEEYNKYHQWRYNSTSYDEEYLKFISLQKPGPTELRAYSAFPEVSVPVLKVRRAACCRLCNLNWIQKMMNKGGHKNEVFDQPYRHSWINHQFFNKTLYKPPKGPQLLRSDENEPDGFDI